MIAPFRKAGAAVTVIGAAVVLAGCSLLSTPDPVQLSRFGSLPEATTNASTMAEPVAVALRRVEFPEASKGDRILGVTGAEAAYIAGARWVSPAEILFNDAVESAFASRPDQVRLLGRREPGVSTRVLSLDVTTFEARYAAPGVAPDAVITVRARMTILPERSVVNERTFTVVQPSGQNRVSAIVTAFDIATRDLNSQIVDWTATATGPAAPAR